MTGKTEQKHRVLDFRISGSGKFAAFKILSTMESGDEYHNLLVFNIKKGKRIFEHQETSITHVEWHPVLDKLLFIGVLSGLNAVDMADMGSKEMSEGIIKHSVLFLEYFHFSPRGKSAGYLLRDISVIPESAELEEKNIQNIILDEEKAQLLFYEKAEVSDRIEGLGRAWNWVDDDLLIYNFQNEIFIHDIVWNSKTKILEYPEFIMDFTPCGKKILVISMDYKNLLTGEGNFNVLILDPGKKTMEPLNIKGDFIPEMQLVGSVLLFNRKCDDKYVVVKFDPKTKEETSITGEDLVSKFPRLYKNSVYFLRYDEDKIDLHSISPSGEDEKKHFCVSDFFEQAE